jgi:soluble lytic murein transglycosylase
MDTKKNLIYQLNFKNPIFLSILLTGIVFFVLHILHINYIQNGFILENSNMKKQFEVRQDSLLNILGKNIDKLQAGISQDNNRRWKIIGIEQYIKKVNSRIPYQKRQSYATFVVNEAETHANIDMSLITSVMKRESYFIYDAVSKKDAVGLMGITEETGRWICKELGINYYKNILENPEINIKIGSWFLSYLISKYKSEILALAHYNGGGLQKNNYINKQALEKTAEYQDITIEEIKMEMKEIKDSISINDIHENKILSARRYNHLRKILSGKCFSSETSEYIPKVLAQREEINLFLSDPAIFSQRAPKDSINSSS